MTALSLVLVEVEHVKAHRSKEEKQQTSLFEKISLRVMRGKTSWQKTEREEVYAEVQCAAGFHCLVEE